MLSVVILEGPNPLVYTWRFLRLLSGKPSRTTQIFTVPQFTLTLDKERTLELDGETTTFGSGEFGTLPRSL